MVQQSFHTIRIRAPRRGLHEFTDEVRAWISSQPIRSGLITLFCRHTSASLVIQENAAPAVRRDMEKFFDALAPEGRQLYEHDDEGPDDMPAHLKAALTQVQLSIPMQEGKVLLGSWQGIFLFEHRSRPLQREIVLHLAGE